MDKLTIDITQSTPILSFTTTGIPGPQGIPGPKGDQGIQGPKMTFSDLTDLEKLELKGEKGDKGDKGDSIKGDKGDAGIQGIQGPALTYADLTPANKADLSKVAVDATQPLVTLAQTAAAQAASAKDQAAISATTSGTNAASAQSSASSAEAAKVATQNAQADVTGKQADVASKLNLVNQAASEVEFDRQAVEANKNTVQTAMATVQAAKTTVDAAEQRTTAKAAEAAVSASNALSEATRAKGYADAINTNQFVPVTRTINGKPLSGSVALTAADVGALPISGGTLGGPLTVASQKGAIKVDGQKSISYQDGGGVIFHTMAHGDSFQIAEGPNGATSLIDVSTGNIETTVPVFASSGVVVQNVAKTSWVGLECPVTGAPYLSVKNIGDPSPHLAVSFGAGGIEVIGGVSANGRVVSNYATGRAWGSVGESAFFNDNMNVTNGVLRGLLSAKTTIPGVHALEHGYGCQTWNDLGECAHVFWSTDSGSYTKTWQLKDSGYLTGPTGNVFGSDGNIAGTVWGAYGTVSNWATNSFAAKSDARLKEHITLTTKSALDEIDKMQFKSYDWKDGKGHVDIGVIAQDMERINPQYTGKTCTYDAEGNEVDPIKTLDIVNLLSVTMKAVQELKAEVESLRTQLEDRRV